MDEDKYDKNWVDIRDRLPGEQGHDSETVAVWLNGLCSIVDHEARNGGPWGFSTGYFDVSRGCFYVGGRPNEWVTHWQPLYKPPATTDEAREPYARLYISAKDLALVVAALRSSKGDGEATREERNLADHIESYEDMLR